jgi:hypothetical protein
MKPGLDFSSLENMCRQQAAAAKREMEYWLAEAEERATLLREDRPIQLDWCAESNNQQPTRAPTKVKS